VHKTSKVHPTHYSAAEWVDRQKKKMIILQELDELDHTLEFIKVDRTVDNNKERTWKEHFNCSVECFALSDSSALFCKAPH
jgi:hypothetical protein